MRLLKILILLLISISYLQAESSLYFQRSIYSSSYKELPRILNDEDLKKYYEIYTLQNLGEYKKADIIIQDLDNKILVGYMLYMRYLKNDYKPTYTELKLWLENYSKLAVAADVHKIASRKAKTTAQKNILKKPSNFYDQFIPIYLRHDLFAEVTSSVNISSVNKITITSNNTTKRLAEYLKKGRTLNTKNMLTDPRVIRSLDANTYDHYAGVLARSYFLDGDDKQAITWGKKAIKRSPELFPDSSFYLGLSYFRMKDYRNALIYFGYITNNINLFSSDIAAKGTYWHARTNLILGNIDKYYHSLNIASQYIYNFYGVLASEELGITPNYSWQYIQFAKNNIQDLVQTEYGKRAFALLQFGLLDWAEQELIALAAYETPLMEKAQEAKILDALIYVAQNINMPALSYKMAGQNGKYYGLSHLSYPVFFLDLKDGYEVDPALLLAIIRRESNFFSGAESTPGAKGLMQLMPSTANNLIKQYNLDYSLSESLISPKANIDLGQKYLQVLFNNPNSEGNLIYVIAGYNGGFTNVENWKRQPHRNAGDPLFFIESIPYYETRAYVKSVMTDYWIYQYKIGSPMYSLHMILEGKQPTYYEVDKEAISNLKTFTYFMSADVPK